MPAFHYLPEEPSRNRAHKYSGKHEDYRGDARLDKHLQKRLARDEAYKAYGKKCQQTHYKTEKVYHITPA